MKSYSEILRNAVRAIEDDGFYFIGITGEKGNGKSTLAWNILVDVLKEVGYELDFIEDKDILLQHLIFTIDDFFNIKNRKGVIRWEDGRVCVALWDDFGLHTSSYAFLKGEGDKVGDFIEFFEVVRENIAVLIVTAATFDLVPPKIRNTPNIILDCYKRGYARVFGRKRNLWISLIWKELNAIKFSEIPREFYNEYRKLKARAIDAKRLMRIVKLEEKAEKLAEKLRPEDWENKELLIAYGICDTFGNLTPFGQLVKRYCNNKRNGNNVIKMSWRKFYDLYHLCGLKGDANKVRRFFNKLKEVGWIEEK